MRGLIEEGGSRDRLRGPDVPLGGCRESAKIWEEKEAKWPPRGKEPQVPRHWPRTSSMRTGPGIGRGPKNRKEKKYGQATLRGGPMYRRRNWKSDRDEKYSRVTGDRLRRRNPTRNHAEIHEAPAEVVRTPERKGEGPFLQQVHPA